MIWDGDINCEHKWEGQQAVAPSNLTAAKEDKEWSTFHSEKYLNQPAFKPTTPFCSLCGAWRGCLGLEPTIELYLKHLVGIFDEAKRVLRDDGVCFVNLGDTYNSSGTKMPRYFDGRENNPEEIIANNKIVTKALPTKSLCLIPFRFAIAMVGRGWILRNTIIWSKPNPMPSSAKDRFTVDFEYVFFFVKKKKYWFEPQYEQFLTESNADRPRMGQGNQTKYHSKRGYGGGGTSFQGHSGHYKADGTRIDNPTLGRNKRTTWTIPTEAFPEAHFATFPQALVEPMIKCGCPEFICKKCGKARVAIYDKEKTNVRPHNLSKGKAREAANGNNPDYQVCGFARTGEQFEWQHIKKGYTSCSCNVGYEPGVVLDFFCGSGTVGKVAAYLRRNYILIDAKKEYCQMAEERVKEPETGLTVAEQRQGQGGLFE